MTAGDRPDIVYVRLQRREKGKRGPWVFAESSKGTAVLYGISPVELRGAFQQADRLNRRYAKSFVYRVVKVSDTDAGTFVDVLDPNEIPLPQAPWEIVRTSL